MKRTLLLVCVLLIINAAGYSQNVTIIESESINSGHVMDTVWDVLLNGMGYNAAIYPQTTLDDTSFFATTDILIVSSGVIALPVNRVQTINQFLLRGGMIYLQTEYDATYTTNQAFASIITSLGGSFAWNGTTAGTLAPMNELGSLSNTPNAVSPLGYFWYGSPGTGCSVEPFLEYLGLHYGFIYCSPVSKGRMITTSDQDWIRQAGANDSLLMKNIIYNLSLSTYTCADSTPQPTATVSSDTVHSSAAASYQWYDLTGALPGDTSQDILAPHTGYYHVCVTYASGCSACSDSVLVRVSQTGTQALHSSTGFQIYPSPAHGNFSILVNGELNMRNAEVLIYDVMGKEVYSERLNQQWAIINHQFPIGVYFVKVSDGSKEALEKLIIE